MKAIARWGLVCFVLTTLATTASAGLYDGWGYKAQIQFTGYDKSETLTNFPALVVLGTNISGFAYGQFRSGMNDLAFTADAAGQTTLNYEIDSWNTNGLSYVWVQVPALTSNATVTAWWGAPGQTAPACATNGATWDGTFGGVWHLGETNQAVVRKDSTAHALNMSPANLDGDEATPGAVAGANGFDASGARNDTMSVASSSFLLPSNNNITVECWFKTSDTTADTVMVGKNPWYTGCYELAAVQWNGTAPVWQIYGGSVVVGPSAKTDGRWHHQAGTWNGSTMVLFIDGVAVADGAATTFGTSTSPLYFGSRQGTGNFYAGGLDEVRISQVARSTNWVWAEYMNVASNASAFQTYGAAILNTNGLPPFVINLPPTSVAPGAAALNGRIVSTGSAPVTVVAVYWGPVDGGTNAALWANTNVYAGSWNQGDALTASVALTPGQDTFYTYAAANAVGGVWATPSAYFTGGALTLAATDASLGSNATDTATVVVSRPATCTNGPLAVYYTLGGAATSGVNYAASPASGSLLIPAGQINAAITLTPLLPLNLNAPMSVTVTLAPGAYVVGAASNVTCTVRQFLPYADYRYTTHNGTITITGYSGAGGAVTLPNTINGLPVTCIGSNAFYGCTTLTGVTIGTNVTTIEDSAFCNCTSLSGVTIPNSVTTIGDEAFCNCASLSGVAIPGSVTRIGGGAFCFCSHLSGVTIPGSVTSIGDSAFFACDNLTGVTIPAGVTNIGDQAFCSCGKLTSIAVATNNPAYSSGAGVLFDKSQATLVEYPQGKTGSYTIPDSVTRIGDDAFYFCSPLTGVTIGTNVATIGDSAFQGCRGLTGVTIPGSVTSIGNSAFYLCTYLTNLTIGASVTNIGSAAFEGLIYLTSLTIPAGVTSMGDMAFANNLSLASVTIGGDVTSNGTTCIGYQAFAGAIKLTSVTFGKSVTRIGDWAFKGCQALTAIAIPVGITSIGDEAFFQCQALTNATIPASVTNIGYAPFDFSGLAAITVDTNNPAYCSVEGVLFDKNQTVLIEYPPFKSGNYTSPGASYTIPDSVTSIGIRAFSYCGESNVTIGAGVTNIGDEAFILFNLGLSSIMVATNNSAYCSVDGVLYDKNLTTLLQCPEGKRGPLTIPDGVTTIGRHACCCYFVTSVAIPDSVTSIGDQAFGCGSATNLTIGNGVTNIGAYAFCGCASLTSVAIPDSVTSMGDYAFDGCGSVTNFTIGTNVTSIGKQAFSDCIHLISVTIPDSVTSIGEEAFSWCSSLGSVTIGSGVTNIGDSAFYDCTNLTYVYFQGNAPTLVGSQVFGADSGNDPATFCYLPGTTGWGTSFGGIPTVLWDPQVACDANFGAHGNQFGFTITGSANLVIVVEACTNLVHPTWAAVGTYILTGGSSCFTDSQWASCPARFYRFRSP